jgi:hypothetical protein
MAIPKKGSRRIIVEQLAYRWSIRPRPTYTQGNAWGRLTFAVELENVGQSSLIVSVDGSRPDNWLEVPSVIITPVIVRRAIGEALRQGWRPTQKGSPHELVLSLTPA